MRIAFVIALGTVAFSGCAHKHTARGIPVPPPPAPADRSTPASANTSASEAARSTPEPTRASARTPSASGAPVKRSTPAAAPSIPPDYVETGKASWYGHPYHGRPAANGEIYDMEKMTAAHRTLPFDTWVRVINLANEKAVDVRITDRGPFVGNRIIDLSHAAAREIGLIGPGTAEVRVEIVSVPEDAPTALYAVQVGAFHSRDNAERERKRMEQQYGRAKLIKREGDTTLWRVLVGSEKTQDAADSLRQRIRKDSHERNGFVVRLDS
jgi:rare lipoprotein A